MSLNFTDDLPSYSFMSPHDFACVDSKTGQPILTAISSTYTLLVLPPSIFVLYLGFQRWRRSSAATVAHSDFFTYNMAASELIGILGHTVYYATSYADLPLMWILGLSTATFTWPAHTLFPILICVERYLAAVHPITYRGLRQGRGVRIRNVTTGCVWLGCFLWLGFVIGLNNDHNAKRVPATVLLIIFFTIMVFCSVSVLSVLVRQQPGKVGRAQINQSKQRAVRTVLILMVVLWLKFGGKVFGTVIRFSPGLVMRCVGEGSNYVFNLPSSLLIPLMFLQRAGKVSEWKHDKGSE